MYECVLILFLFYVNFSNNYFKDVLLQWQQKYCFNDDSYPYKNGTHLGKKSPFEHDVIEVIGTRPAINTSFSPMGIKKEFPHAGQ